MSVAIIGDGGWGTALGILLARGGHQVTMWSHDAAYLQQMKDTRINPKFLPGIPLPENWNYQTDPAAAVHDAEAVVLAVPSKFFRATLERFAGLIPPRVPVVSVAKGLDQQSHQRMTVVAEQALRHQPVAALSGPSLADEVARATPTAVTIACADHDVAVKLQHLFNGPTFRVYTSDDVTGVEIGGALKNVIAIAAGISDGLGYGDNTKAALVTRGLAEIIRLGIALGARRETFAGLSGVGDLMVTCNSRLSRNRGVGERLGRGEKMSDILATMQQVAEGVWTCRAARNLAREVGIELPITDQVFAVCHEEKNPRRTVIELMSRDPKPEKH
jgi:glycerol-3-phosphate dehydrogenase (NAD(P)+)